MTRIAHEFQAAPDPATRSELDKRRAQRATPEATPHLTPGGWIETDVNREVDARNERRIAFLNERLGNEQDHASRDFAASRGEAMDWQSREGPARSFALVR